MGNQLKKVTDKLNITGIPDANGTLPQIIDGGSNRLFIVESGGELVIKNIHIAKEDIQLSGSGVVCFYNASLAW